MAGLPWPDICTPALLHALGWRGSDPFRKLCRSSRAQAAAHAEETRDAEVHGIFGAMAGVAQNAAGVEPAEQLRLAGWLRQRALCVLEILRAPSCADLDVRDMYGLDAGQLFELMVWELQAMPPASAKILRARRALQAARRVEEFHYAQENVPYTVVSAAGRLRPATRPPIYITSEGSDAPESAQSDDFVAPTIWSGTTLDVATSSFAPFRLEGTTQTGAAMRSLSGVREILPQVEQEECELGGADEAFVAVSQHIALQRQLLRAGIRTCPEGHDLQEREGRRGVTCDLCDREIKSVTLCCVQCDWHICQECAGLAGLPNSQDADEDVPQRAAWWMLRRQSRMLKEKGDLRGAAAILEAALKQLRPGLQDSDAVTLHQLGVVRKQKGDLEQAAKHLKEALRMTKSVDDGADHVNVAVTSRALGMLLKQTGELEQAAEHLKEALRMKRSAYGGADHLNVAGILHDLGMLLHQKGDLEQAEEHLKEALRMTKSVYGGADHVNNVETWQALGMLLKQKGDLEQAEEHLKEALWMTKSVYGGADHVIVAVTLRALGMLLKQQGDLEQALEHLKEALRMMKSVYGGADDESVAVTLHALGMLLQEKGDLQQAEEHLREALRMMTAVYAGEDHKSVAGTLHQLGVVLKQTGDLAQAEEHLKEAVRMKESLSAGADHVEVAVTLHELGMLLKQKGDLEQAAEHLKEELRMKKSVFAGADHVEVAVTLHVLGMLLKQKGDLEQAEEHLKEALRMTKSVYDGADHVKVAFTLYELGMWLKQKGDPEQAVFKWPSLER